MSGQRVAVVRRVMPAPPEVVYDEWLDSEALADWMCPSPARATAVRCDPRVGGLLQIDIDDSGTPMTVTGQFVDLRRPHLISFSWHCTTWPAGAGVSLVTVGFEPYGAEQTLMTIQHSNLDEPLVDQHHRGWARITEQLADALRRRAAMGPACPGAKG